MRKFALFFTLILLAALAVGADFAAGRLFETRARSMLQQEFRLEEEPVVQVRDFPFLVSLVRERLDTVDVAASGVRAGDVTLDQVRIDLRNVEIPRSVLLGDTGTVTIGRAGGRIRVSENEISRLLERQVPGARLRLLADGMRVDLAQQVFGQAVDVSLTGTPSLEDGQLRFQPEAVETSVQIPPAVERLVLAQTYTVEIPPLPGGLTVDRMVTEPGALVLFASTGMIQIDASGISTPADAGTPSPADTPQTLTR